MGEPGIKLFTALASATILNLEHLLIQLFLNFF